MKIQDVKHQYQPFDVASGLGFILIGLGVAEQYSEPIPMPKFADTKWGIRGAFRADGGIVGPAVSYSCSTCGQRGFIGSQYKTFTFNHCGILERVPADIQAQFKPFADKYYTTQEAPRSLRDKATDQNYSGMPNEQESTPRKFSRPQDLLK